MASGFSELISKADIFRVISLFKGYAEEGIKINDEKKREISEIEKSEEVEKVISEIEKSEEKRRGMEKINREMEQKRRVMEKVNKEVEEKRKEIEQVNRMMGGKNRKLEKSNERENTKVNLEKDEKRGKEKVRMKNEKQKENKKENEKTCVRKEDEEDEKGEMEKREKKKVDRKNQERNKKEENDRKVKLWSEGVNSHFFQTHLPSFDSEVPGKILLGDFGEEKRDFMAFSREEDDDENVGGGGSDEDDDSDDDDFGELKLSDSDSDSASIVESFLKAKVPHNNPNLTLLDLDEQELVKKLREEKEKHHLSRRHFICRFCKEDVEVLNNNFTKTLADHRLKPHHIEAERIIKERRERREKREGNERREKREGNERREENERREKREGNERREEREGNERREEREETEVKMLRKSKIISRGENGKQVCNICNEWLGFSRKKLLLHCQGEKHKLMLQSRFDDRPEINETGTPKPCNSRQRRQKKPKEALDGVTSMGNDATSKTEKPVDSILQNNLHFLQPISEKELQCNLCKTVLPSAENYSLLMLNILEHLKSKLHVSNVDIQKTGGLAKGISNKKFNPKNLRPSTYKFLCLLCNFDGYGYKFCQSHMKSELHENRVKKTIGVDLGIPVDFEKGVHCYRCSRNIFGTHVGIQNHLKTCHNKDK